MYVESPPNESGYVLFLIREHIFQWKHRRASIGRSQQRKSGIAKETETM